MSEYKRMVSYLYKYENGAKGRNIGYVRIEVRQGDLKLQVSIKDPKGLNDVSYKVYFYYHEGRRLKGIYGGDLLLKRGEGAFRTITKEAAIFKSNYNLEDMGGMIIYYNNELAYGTEWDDHAIQMHYFEADSMAIPPIPKESQSSHKEFKEAEHERKPAAELGANPAAISENKVEIISEITGTLQETASIVPPHNQRMQLQNQKRQDSKSIMEAKTELKTEIVPEIQAEINPEIKSVSGGKQVPQAQTRETFGTRERMNSRAQEPISAKSENHAGTADRMQNSVRIEPASEMASSRTSNAVQQKTSMNQPRSVVNLGRMGMQNSANAQVEGSSNFNNRTMEAAEVAAEIKVPVSSMVPPEMTNRAMQEDAAADIDTVEESALSKEVLRAESLDNLVMDKPTGNAQQNRNKGPQTYGNYWQSDRRQYNNRMQNGRHMRQNMPNQSDAKIQNESSNGMSGQMRTNQSNPGKVEERQINQNQAGSNQRNAASGNGNPISPNQTNAASGNGNPISQNQRNAASGNGNPIGQNQRNANQENGNQTSAAHMNTNQANGNQTSAAQVHANQANANQTRASQMNANQANGSQTSAGQMNANQANANQMNQNRMNGNRMNPNQANANQMNQNRMNGKRMNPNQINPNQNNSTNGFQSQGQQAQSSIQSYIMESLLKNNMQSSGGNYANGSPQNNNSNEFQSKLEQFTEVIQQMQQMQKIQQVRNPQPEPSDRKRNQKMNQPSSSSASGTMPENQKTVPSEMAAEPDHTAEKANCQEEQSASGSSQMEALFRDCPRLPHTGNNQIIESVRITPQDIGKLDRSNWKFGNNSFLIHGFYNYHYLLLGRVGNDSGEIKEVLGVPGVFDNRAKYMASQFGFGQFIPAKPAPLKTGAFGYWIVELSRENRI